MELESDQTYLGLYLKSQEISRTEVTAHPDPIIKIQMESPREKRVNFKEREEKEGEIEREIKGKTHS